MASEVDSRKAPANPDALVQRKLADVCRRMRRLEALGTLAVFAVVTLAYAFGMALVDLATRDWPAATFIRWLGFALFVSAAAALLGRLVLLSLRRINPYYAARQLERTVPDAHNSLINWLDLHGEAQIPAAFRKNLGAYAARHIKQSDPDQVLDRRRQWWLLGGGIVLLIALLVLLARDPQQFLSLMQRAFLPFRAAAVAQRTHITLLRPDGNVRVSPNQVLSFAAHITGRVPDVNEPGAVALHYRYQPQDDFIILPMRPDELGNWALRMSGDQVRTGFAYKLRAGDAETPLYQVEVRAPAQAQRFEVTYQYRPYLGLSNTTIGFPNQDEVFPRLAGHEGTDVELVVRTDRPLARAGIELTQSGARKELAGQVLADDPAAFRCRWTLERSGQFRVRFTSTEGEANIDAPTAYDIQVLEDAAPRVVLTQPAQDVALPANGTLPLEGKAEDDIGIKALTLRLQSSKVELLPKRYLDGKSLRFTDGSFPDVLEYSDFIALDQLKTAKGEPFAVAPGMVLQYWLEAVDSSDFPNKEGRLGKSLAYKITIQPPDTSAAKQQEQRKQAEDRRRQQEKQQKDKLAKHDQEKQQQPQPNQGEGEQKAKDELARLEKEKQQTENQLQKALEQQDKQEPKEQSSQGKGQDSKSEKKDGAGKNEKKDGASKNDGSQGDKKDSPAEKPAQNKDQGASAGSSKDAGQQQPMEGTKPENKQPQGKPDAAKPGKDEAAGAPKDGGKGQNPQAGDKAGSAPQEGAKGKNEAPQGKDQQPGSAKAEGPKPGQGDGDKDGKSTQDAPAPQAKSNSGKDQQAKQPGEPAGRAEKDNGGGQTPQAGKAPPGQAKGEQADSAKAEAKDRGDAAGQPQAKQKGDGGPGKEPSGAQAKDAPADQAKQSGTAKGASPPGSDMKEPSWEEVARLVDQARKKEGGGDAAKELADIGKSAGDPKMRQAAREALAQAGRDPDTGKEGPPETPREPPTPQAKEDVPEGAPGSGKSGNSPDGRKSSDKRAQGKPEEADAQQGQKASVGGQPAPGGKGADAELEQTEGNKDFATRGGNLQLEDLKKRVTPELLKQAGLTEADWQRYLQQAEAYNRLLQKLKSARPTPGATDARGKGGQLPGAGPSQVRGQAPDSSPLNAGQAQPPPELREAQRRFTAPK